MKNILGNNQHFFPFFSVRIHNLEKKCWFFSTIIFTFLHQKLLMLEIRLLSIYRRLQSREFRKAKTNIYLPRQLYLCYEKKLIQKKLIIIEKWTALLLGWRKSILKYKKNQLEKLLFIVIEWQQVLGNCSAQFGKCSHVVFIVFYKFWIKNAGGDGFNFHGYPIILLCNLSV